MKVGNYGMGCEVYFYIYWIYVFFRPKSRVRDTIKLFDAKYKPARGSRSNPTKSRPLTSPKTGGGEGMAGDSMEDKYK